MYNEDQRTSSTRHSVFRALGRPGACALARLLGSPPCCGRCRASGYGARQEQCSSTSSVTQRLLRLYVRPTSHSCPALRSISSQSAVVCPMHARPTRPLRRPRRPPVSVPYRAKRALWKPDMHLRNGSDALSPKTQTVRRKEEKEITSTNCSRLVLTLQLAIDTATALVYVY